MYDNTSHLYQFCIASMYERWMLFAGYPENVQKL